MVGAIYNQYPVARSRFNALNVPEDFEVTIEPPAGFKFNTHKIIFLRFVFKKTNQVIAQAFLMFSSSFTCLSSANMPLVLKRGVVTNRFSESGFFSK